MDVKRVAFLALLMLFAGCSGGGGTTGRAGNQPAKALESTAAAGSALAPPAGSAPLSARARGDGLHNVVTIILLVMENHGFEQVIGSRKAPYLNELAAAYGLATAYHAVAHPSLPNYLALIAGDTLGVTSDCTDCLQQAPTLVDQLEARGRTWKGYIEDLPSTCSMASEAGAYALKHNPFLYFRQIRSQPDRCGRVVPFSDFGADLAAGTLPSFAWITPNLMHDTHDSDVGTGDAWLSRTVPAILASPAWQNGGLLLITWDEAQDGDDSGCCGGEGGGHVATLVIAPGMTSGARTARPASHYSLLRAIEDAWGLPPLAQEGNASSDWLADLLQPPAQSP